MDVYSALGVTVTTSPTYSDEEAIIELSPKYGMPALKQDVAVALLSVFGNRYPSPDFESVRLVNGQFVSSQGFDPQADLFLFRALVDKPASGPETVAYETVFDQIRKAAPGTVAVVNKKDVAKIFAGDLVPTEYALAKNLDVAKSFIASTVDSSGTTKGVLLPPEAVALVSSGSGEGGAAPEKKKFSIVLPLVGAGVGLLVGGPVGAVVGAGIGVGVEAVRAA